MAERRMLWKQISLSRKVNGLSLKAAFLWTWVQPHLDPEGFIEAEADYLKHTIVPLRKEIREKDIPLLVQEIINIGLWEPYNYDEVLVIKEKAFHEKQNIRRNEDGNPRDEAPSRFVSKLSKIIITPGEPQGNPRGTPGEPQTSVVKCSVVKCSVGKGNGSNEPDSIRCNISFSFQDRCFLGIEQKDIEEWKKAYPAVDIDIEINRAKEWLLANPKKRKKNYRRFLVNWFNYTQERGGTKNGSKPRKKYGLIDE